MIFPLPPSRSWQPSNSLIPYSLYLSVNRNQTGKQTNKKNKKENQEAQPIQPVPPAHR